MKPQTKLKEGQILSGPLFSEPMRVETISENGDGCWSLGLVGIKTERFRKVNLSPALVLGRSRLF